MKGVDAHHFYRRVRWLAKFAVQATGSLSIPASTQSNVPTAGFPLKISGQQIVHIIMYYAEWGEDLHTGNLLATAAPAIDVFAPLLTTPLQEFVPQSQVQSKVAAAPGGLGETQSAVRIGTYLTDHWLNWDDFPGVATPPGTLTILGTRNIFNNDAGAAHTVNFRESIQWELWETIQ